MVSERETLIERLRDAADISAAYYPKDLDHPPLLREAAQRIEELERDYWGNENGTIRAAGELHHRLRNHLEPPTEACPVCGGNGLDPVDPFNGDPSGMDAGGGLIYSHDDAPCPNPECVEGRVRES